MLIENQNFAGRQKPCKCREMHSYSGWSSVVWGEKTRLSVNTHNGGVPASRFSPPTQLSTLLTLDLLHIKGHSLQKPSHMHRKIWGGSKREPGGRNGGGRTEGVEGEQPHSYCIQKYHSIQISSSCFLPHLQDLEQGKAETRNSLAVAK